MRYFVYDASGNTFVILYAKEKKDYSTLAIDLCKKENTDGLIVVNPHKTYDFVWDFYNNDGSNASMCGNGTRAVAHFAFNNNIAKKSMQFLTKAGVISCVVDDNIVQTTMTKPKEIKKPFEKYNLTWYLIDTGVPHLVTIVKNLDSFDISLCKKLRDEFDANVNFAMVKDEILYVRTFERGVEGETLACGTGMVASFLRALSLKLIKNNTKVYPKSGELITIQKQNDTIYFTGEVKLVK